MQTLQGVRQLCGGSRPRVEGREPPTTLNPKPFGIGILSLQLESSGSGLKQGLLAKDLKVYSPLEQIEYGVYGDLIIIYPKT